MTLAAGGRGAQVWGRQATSTGSLFATATPENRLTPCSPMTLPSGAIIDINPTLTLTLTDDAVFRPLCTGALEADSTGSGTNGSFFADQRDPFYASMTPQVYATAAATVLAWMLVITLLITPRTFFVGGAGGRSGLLGRNGMISGSTGGASVIGVGSRPWLQKVAALTVAISLTIATADTFKVAAEQYQTGFMDASAIRTQVVAGLEIKISRVISDIFIWLAQVQTLIRLFPRHKEKVLIKWVGFALVILDMTFKCLNSFMGDDVTKPVEFVEALPTLNYLFQLTLSILYAAWVIYYAFGKRQYAFYHWMMWNVTLCAFLSIIAILTPVVFFVTDISQGEIAGWGDYFRWVGAAAASVIVWEWVERIEALEREEKKDGILGREVFDGDAMVHVTALDGPDGSDDGRFSFDKRDGFGGSGGAFSSGTQDGKWGRMVHRIGQVRHDVPYAVSRIPLGRARRRSSERGEAELSTLSQSGPDPAHTLQVPPRTFSSSLSRTNSTSAASTVYAVRYHPNADSVVGSEPHPRRQAQSTIVEDQDEISPTRDEVDVHSQSVLRTPPADEHDPEKQEVPTPGAPSLWKTLTRSFRPHRTPPPPEVVRSARVVESAGAPDMPSRTPQPPQQYSRLDFRSRIGAIAAESGDKLRELTSGRQPETKLPITVIPAQSRSRVLSPQDLNSTGTSGHDHDSSVPADADLDGVIHIDPA